MHWTVAAISNSMSFRMFSPVGYCAGQQRPRYGPVKVIERGRRVYVTAQVREVDSGNGICRDVGFAIERTVRLRQFARNAAIYDGSTSPSQRRWPRRSDGVQP